MFRDIWPDGDIYEGGFNMGQKHGKGEFEFFEDKQRIVGQWINNKREGEFTCYDKHGNMTIKHYKDGKEVEE